MRFYLALRHGQALEVFLTSLEAWSNDERHRSGLAHCAFGSFFALRFLSILTVIRR